MGTQRAKKMEEEMPHVMVSVLRTLPEWLRKGPWSPMAYLFLICFSIILLRSFAEAQSSFLQEDVAIGKADPWLIGWRLILGGWCLIFAGGMLMSGTAFWIFASYTMWSWIMVGLRLFSAGLLDLGVEGGGVLKVVAGALRFPALVQSTVTVVLWWLVIQPIMWVQATPKNRKGLIQMNTSFLLINLHLLVLVFILGDFWGANQPLRFFDLWCSLAIALSYLLVYLNTLDAADLAMYIFLSPRTNLCFLAYSGILGLYLVVFTQYNNSLGLNNPLHSPLPAEVISGHQIPATDSIELVSKLLQIPIA